MPTNEEMLIRVYQQHEVLMQSFREIAKVQVASLVDLLRVARILGLPILVPVSPGRRSESPQSLEEIFPIEKISKLKPYVFDGANRTVYIYLES
ncbi:MAG: hypothetical protein QW728_01635 [Thermoplasmata archaeon]